MDKQTVAYSSNVMLLRDKMEWTTDVLITMDKLQNNYVSKRIQTKRIPTI